MIHDNEIRQIKLVSTKMRTKFRIVLISLEFTEVILDTNLKMQHCRKREVPTSHDEQRCLKSHWDCSSV